MGPVRNVDDLMTVGHGYQRSMVLLAALKLGVFRALAGGAADALGDQTFAQVRA